MAMTPRFAMRRSSASSFVPSQRFSGLRPIRRPTPNVALAASIVPTAAQTKPSTGPSVTTVAPINARIGTETTLADDEHDEHERHAPRAAAPATRCRRRRARAMSRHAEPQVARSRTAATRRPRRAPSSASAPLQRPRVANARRLRDELARPTRHARGRRAARRGRCSAVLALDRLDAAVGGRPCRAAPGLQSRVTRAVRRAEDRHARQRRERRANAARRRRARRRRSSRRCPSARRSTDCARTRSQRAAAASSASMARSHSVSKPIERLFRFDEPMRRNVSSTISTFACTWIDSVPSTVISARLVVGRVRRSARAARRTECGSASDGSSNAAMKCCRPTPIVSASSQPPGSRVVTTTASSVGFARMRATSASHAVFDGDVLVLDVDEPLGAADRGDGRALDLADLLVALLERGERAHDADGRILEVGLHVLRPSARRAAAAGGCAMGSPPACSQRVASALAERGGRLALHDDLHVVHAARTACARDRGAAARRGDAPRCPSVARSSRRRRSTRRRRR